MGKLTNTMETKFLPLAQKFSHQKYLQAISNAFLSIIPFLTIGSLALVITCPPVDYTTLEPGFLHSFFKGWAALAAAISSSSVASAFPHCRFSRIVPLNSTAFCGTTPILSRRTLGSYARTSLPATLTLPSVTS